MEREEIERRAELYSALADGKTIQILNMEGNWVDVEVKKLNYIPETLKFRIKPEPKYSPFKTQEECWQEMMKHQPFGWIKSKITKQIYCIGVVAEEEMYCFNDFWNYQDAFEQFTFIDGTPFGI